mmetsp:Transcript_116935/g.342436  ORF Transcript_116935/g.342436 Transcript_116935/m.342436 type:complete len:239 (+) Transcript_116935:579-1295(+)
MVAGALQAVEDELHEAVQLVFVDILVVQQEIFEPVMDALLRDAELVILKVHEGSAVVHQASHQAFARLREVELLVHHTAINPRQLSEEAQAEESCHLQRELNPHEEDRGVVEHGLVVQKLERPHLPEPHLEAVHPADPQATRVAHREADFLRHPAPLDEDRHAGDGPALRHGELLHDFAEVVVHRALASVRGEEVHHEVPAREPQRHSPLDAGDAVAVQHVQVEVRALLFQGLVRGGT